MVESLARIPPVCQNTTQQWGSSGRLFNEFYDTLNLLDLTAIKEITFLKVAQNKPTQANNGISVVILTSELYHVSPSPSVTTAVLTADYGTLFHQIKHQRDVVKATYGPLSKVVSLALH